MLVAAIAVPGASRSPAAAQGQATTATLVADYADWIDGRRATVDLSAIDLDVTRRELGRLDPSSLPVDPSMAPAEARERRRRVLTSFAIEVAAIGSKRHASAAARLVEWACAYVRSHTPVNDFDRAWQLAALSVLEGGIDSQTLRDHLEHTLPVFKGDPRLILARGVAEEQFNAPAEALTRTIRDASNVKARQALAQAESEHATERAIARFQEAAADPDVRAEAALRLGHVELVNHRFDAALATWKGLEVHTQDPVLLFLVKLFRGIAYEGRARLDESRASYLAALRISPGAHSATLRLAALEFRYGHDEAPTVLTEELLRNDDPRRDPWWSVLRGGLALLVPPHRSRP